MSYVHSWFLDQVNFKGKQTREWETDFATMASRKLFMRADQRRYIEKLESALAEKGVDVKDFQSQLRYKQVSMKV